MDLNKIKCKEQFEFALLTKRKYEEKRHEEIEFQDFSPPWLETEVKNVDPPPSFKLILNDGKFSGLAVCSLCEKPFIRKVGNP